MTDQRETKARVDAKAPTTPTTIEESVELAKRAFALRKYEQAVDHYATALELMTAQHGDDAPEAADLYFSYGKALLENAISQSAVLGKEQTEDALAKDGDDDVRDKNGPFLSFSGDGEDEDVAMADGEDVAVDLFAEANAAVEAEDKDQDQDQDQEEGEGEEDGPEDDFNAAWEVLDLARALYEKQQEEDDEIKLKLADTYIALGDVSLETEKFDQAITDYSAGVKLKSELLPLSSRQIAEAHYKLSMVLDLTSGRLAQAIEHAEKALRSVEARLLELRQGLKGELTPVSAAGESPKNGVGVVDVKGKGKGKAPARTKLVRDDMVQNMSKAHIEVEIKELEGLKDDLGLKVDELKTSPGGEFAASAPELAARALDRELNAPSFSTNVDPGKPAVINDLTKAVKKKKKAPTDEQMDGVDVNGNGNGKRKAEDGGEASSESKKAKVETA